MGNSYQVEKCQGVNWGGTRFSIPSLPYFFHPSLPPSLPFPRATYSAKGASVLVQMRPKLCVVAWMTFAQVLTHSNPIPPPPPPPLSLRLSPAHVTLVRLFFLLLPSPPPLLFCPSLSLPVGPPPPGEEHNRRWAVYEIKRGKKGSSRRAA
jgi:hypothetical protein